jgi:putative ABC transport system substrate-binding protein
MRRHEFIAVAGGAATLLPPRGRTQSRKLPKVGILVIADPGSETFWQKFQAALRELGYIDGQTARFEFRSDRGQPARLPELAAELVRLQVDAIVTWFTPAAAAAKQATRDIPIVMALAGDPVATGLVESLSRPGGNVTGMTGDAAELAGKNVEFIRELLPTARRIAALVNVSNPFSKPFLEQVQLAASATGTSIEPARVHKVEEVDAAFAAIAAARPDAVIVQPTLGVGRVAKLAIEYRLPAASPFRPFADEGGLMSYWFSDADLYRRGAAILDKVLKGARPADLPVEQPTKFELVINLKTAKALGLTVPQPLLLRTDEVIE